MHLARVELHPERYPTTERYPFNLAIFQQTRILAFETPVTFFIGENGTGKSTLLEAIARKCDIHIWQGLKRARFERNPHEAQLHRALQRPGGKGDLLPTACEADDPTRLDLVQCPVTQVQGHRNIYQVCPR